MEITKTYDQVGFYLENTFDMLHNGNTNKGPIIHVLDFKMHGANLKKITALPLETSHKTKNKDTKVHN